MTMDGEDKVKEAKFEHPKFSWSLGIEIPGNPCATVGMSSSESGYEVSRSNRASYWGKGDGLTKIGKSYIFRRIREKNIQHQERDT